MERRYSSFIIRRWRLAETEERVEVTHMQSGQRVTLVSLAEAVRWMAATDAPEDGETGRSA